MSYVIQATLSNPAHPEYGVATIPFPLPMKEYDHSMEVLEALEVGDAVRRDCRVDEIDSNYSVLKRLEGLSVNVDELDYLAKRLDSFTAGCEDAQFQAMAEKLDLTDIKDFINLTFCCQQATVITDFSDLERIGKDHYMNLNGGCASTEELENLDGEETALLLIDSGTGVVTPYGVVYDNGMELEPLYRGGPFPPYLYDIHPLVLEATPLSEPEDVENMTLLCLPMTDRQLEHALARGKTGDVEQIRFKVDSIFVQNLGCVPNLEQESLTALNEMCRAIAALKHNELIKFGAAITFAQPQSAMQVKHLAENLELFEFILKVKTPEEYGKYMIQESGRFDYDDNLEGFYDFAGYPGGNGVCDTVTKGKQDLYLHPMNFSGVIQEESIPELEALMRGAHSFQCYATDRYEEYLDMSDSEYLEYLESRREEIVSSLLDECRTPRCNLFKAGPIAETIATRFSLHRLCDKQNTNSHANRFVSEVMEQLVAEGRLVTAHTRQGEGVRTATAKELGEQCHKPTEQTEGQMSMTM